MTKRKLKLREDRKIQVLKLIKENTRMSTSRIGGTLALGYVSILDVLEDLEKDGKVIRDKETIATYWRMKR